MNTVDTGLRINLLFSSSGEKLFDAWTDPEIMKRWLFKGPHSEIVRVERDLSVGGRFSIVERTPEGETDHFGVYRELSRPHRLAFSLEVPAHFDGRTLVEVDFKQISDASEMCFHQTGVDPSVVEQSWRTMFINLTETLVRE